MPAIQKDSYFVEDEEFLVVFNLWGVVIKIAQDQTKRKHSRFFRELFILICYHHGAGVRELRPASSGILQVSGWLVRGLWEFSHFSCRQ